MYSVGLLVGKPPLKEPQEVCYTLWTDRFETPQRITKDFVRMRGIKSSTLLFQVRSLAQTLSEKVRLSTLVGAENRPVRELDAVAALLLEPSVKRKNAARFSSKGRMDAKTLLENKAESYLRKHVLARVTAKGPLPKNRPLSASDFRPVVWKIFEDIEKTMTPATLLACLILNLRDAQASLKDMDVSGKVTPERMMNVLARDVYAARARAQLYCQGTSSRKGEKIALSREITSSLDFLQGLAEIVGVPLPSENSSFKVAVMESAQILRAQAEKEKTAT